MGKEKNFQNKVEKFLNDEGIYYIKYWGGGIYTRSGIPDLVCCVKGVFVSVELKANGGRVSDLQYYNVEKIHQSGGVAFILYPDDFKVFKCFIKTLEEEMSKDE
jgi:Holliday junction resolvase